MQSLATPLTPAEYADIQTALGARVAHVGGLHWVRGRGCFWRPLLRHQAYPAPRVTPPFSWASGHQYAVTNERDANSVMEFVVLDSPESYALEGLSKKRRRLISIAAKQMEVRPIRDLRELQEKGFEAYVSFYQRTGYRYLSNRRREAHFRRWADTVMREPRLLILGGYGAAGLAAVSISYWVEETLIYATYFCHSDAMKQGMGELMFHTLRQIAAGMSGLRQILVRGYQGGNSMDQYYLLRGAKVLRVPAKLRLNPVIGGVLKCCLPKRYLALCGAATAAGNGNSSHEPLPHPGLRQGFRLRQGYDGQDGGQADSLPGQDAFTSPE